MRKYSGVIIVVSAVLLAFAGTATAAQWANPDILVTPAIVEKNITKPDWVVVDCRDLKDYAKGHIPGAISLGKRCKKALRDPTSRVFTSARRYERLLGKAGIGNNTHVILYGGQKSKTLNDAAVGFWLLEYLGHDKVHVLNGGLEAWKQERKKLVRKPSRKKPTTFKARVIKSRIATTEEILQIARGQKKGVQLIDSRTKKEYAGTDIRSLKGGRIPNCTLQVSHVDTYDQKKDPKTGKNVATSFLSPERMSNIYKKLNNNKRTIAYCQTGTRSTLTYMELRLLGYKNPANYDDSWVIYGSNARFPVAGEQNINLARIKKLEDKIKKLEKQLQKKK